MVDIHSDTAKMRRGKKKKEETTSELVQQENQEAKPV